MKTAQLQIRVTPKQKAELRRRARLAGQDLSTYVLTQALPEQSSRFQEILLAAKDPAQLTFALASLNDLLAGLGSADLSGAVAAANVAGLSPRVQNTVAAMVEQACARARIPPPAWTADIEPLDTPWFAGGLKKLRPYLLRVSPLPFRRRNLFVDASVGDRV